MKINITKRTRIITTIVCLLPVLIGLALYSKIPDTIVTHWDMNGNPNGWNTKFVGVIVFPGILLIINMLFPFIIKIDPKHRNMDSKLLNLFQWIIPIISIFCSGITLASALGKEVKVALMGSILLGLLFTVIGNYLPKTGQSYTLGIRIPWTLNSEENWNRTHRFAGGLWVVGGLLIIILGVFGLSIMVNFAAVIIMVFIPCIYSYILYRRGI